MTRPGHDHDGDRLTFGCPACIQHAEDERWRTATLRTLTWTLSYNRDSGYTVQTWARVPDGAGASEVMGRYAHTAARRRRGIDDEIVAVDVGDEVTVCQPPPTDPDQGTLV